MIVGLNLHCLWTVGGGIYDINTNRQGNTLYTVSKDLGTDIKHEGHEVR